MKLYVYGLTEPGGEAVPPDLAGIGNRPVRAERAGPLVAVVSELDDASDVHDKVRVDRDNALAHERVLDAVLERVTPLPFRFGTIVTPERLAEFVNANIQTLNQDLARVRGCVQMSVKFTVKTVTGTEAPPESSELGPGTRFLKEKQAGREPLRTAAEWMSQSLDGWIRDAGMEIRSTAPALATVAHLVEKSGVEGYRARVEELCAKRPDLSWLLSGPWPPYSFVRTGRS
jgi:hypothetical protein